MLNNLQLTQPSLSTQSPLRDSLVHLTLSGCQSINESAIDILLRLSHSHLPKLQHIDMAGLQLELCQQAAKSFLREKLGKLDSLGTMGAFTLGHWGEKGAYTLGQDLPAKHLTRWLEEDSQKAWKKIYQVTNICNHPPGGPPVTRQSDNSSWAVPFHHSANLFNMSQTGMFRMEEPLRGMELHSLRHSASTGTRSRGSGRLSSNCHPLVGQRDKDNTPTFSTSRLSLSEFWKNSSLPME